MGSQGPDKGIQRAWEAHTAATGVAMPDVTVGRNQKAVHEITLTANTISTITFTVGTGTIEVLSHDGLAPVYITVDGTTPTVKGPMCYVIPATMGTQQFQTPTTDRVTVKLISAGAPTVSVTRIDT